MRIFAPLNPRPREIGTFSEKLCHHYEFPGCIFFLPFPSPVLRLLELSAGRPHSTCEHDSPSLSFGMCGGHTAWLLCLGRRDECLILAGELWVEVPGTAPRPEPCPARGRPSSIPSFLGVWGLSVSEAKLLLVLSRGAQVISLRRAPCNGHEGQMRTKPLWFAALVIWGVVCYWAFLILS